MLRFWKAMKSQVWTCSNWAKCLWYQRSWEAERYLNLLLAVIVQTISFNLFCIINKDAFYCIVLLVSNRKCEWHGVKVCQRFYTCNHQFWLCWCQVLLRWYNGCTEWLLELNFFASGWPDLATPSRKRRTVRADVTCFEIYSITKAVNAHRKRANY